MNIVITDCKDSKCLALKGVCIAAFGLNNFHIEYFEKIEENKECPLSFDDLEWSCASKMTNLATSSSSKKYNSDDVVYYATIKKGFIKTFNKSWILVAYAIFRKKSGVWFTGISESKPVPAELWQYMDLPEKERCKNFREFDSMLGLQPLVYYIDGTSEVDWYKQSFKNCVSACLKYSEK